MNKPILEVVCAIIEHEGRILVVRRKKGEKMEGLWEFPGGKIDEGESPDISISREILEELGIIIVPYGRLPVITYAYPDFIIHLLPFLCHFKKGKVKLKVHDLMNWVSRRDLLKINLCDADKLIARVITTNI
jgi:8-oxo-dGTP diphosphatase